MGWSGGHENLLNETGVVQPGICRAEGVILMGAVV